MPSRESQPDPVVGDDLDVRSRSIVDLAVEDLKDARLSKPTRILAQTVLWGLRRRREYDGVITDVERLTNEIGQISKVLERCAAALREEEAREAERQPGTDVWWHSRTRAVVRALNQDRRYEGQLRWTTLWVDGLGLEQWDRCRSLLDVEGLPPEPDVLGRMRAITQALADERYAAALDDLDHLVEPASPASRSFDRGAVVRLCVLRTRILLREFSDRDVIREAAELALACAGDGPWASLALAARAETQLAANDVEGARRTLKRATRADDPPTDTVIVSGMLLERDGMWAMADEYYDAAVQADPDATRAVLLRPVPARLLVRAAVSAGVPTAQAVALLDRALAIGVTGDEDYPEKHVHLARAAKLTDVADEQEASGAFSEARHSRFQAATSLVEAGQRYSWSDSTARAVELFGQACALAPEVPQFRWTYAEGLRLDANRPDGTTDVQQMEAAREQVEHGLALRQPEDSEAWVLVTQAMIEDGLPDPRHDPAVLVERALLKDPWYALAYGFLTAVLRRQGYLQEALEASEEARQTAQASDPFVFETHLSLLLDRGDHDEALRLLDRQSLRRPDDEDLPVLRAGVLLRLGHAEAAVSELADRRPSDSLRITLGHCLFAAGEAAAARDEFWSLWIDTRSSPAAGVAGWAAYRAGLLDQGIELYRDLHRRAPATMPYTRDLGQMLLVRGQVEEGTALLRDGIATCPYAEELTHLSLIEFDYVRTSTADRPHGAEVASALDQLDRLIERRREVLLTKRRPPDALPALLGGARRALHDDRPLEALHTYVSLAGSAAVPEAVMGAVRAGDAARLAADRCFVDDDDHDGARSQWLTVERALLEIHPDPDPGLRLSLVCRRMLVDLVDGAQEEVTAWLAGATVDADLELALTTAARTLAHDPPLLWALNDGLRTIAGRADIGEDVRRLAQSVVEQLPLAQAYHLEAAQADTQGSTFLFVNPLEVRLGPGLADLLDSDELLTSISGLQSRIEADMGVQIPWVYPVLAPSLDDRRADVRVYGRWVGGIVLPEDRDTWVPELMGKLDSVVRGHLFRLVGVDDVALWLEGWDLSEGDAPAWDQPDPQADRLRLARVLRMLLREGVSVRDREAIVGVLRAPDGVDRRRDSATLDTLREVRRRLGPAALGLGPDAHVVPLPAELEEQARSGLTDDRPVWELPRDRSYSLVRELRRWLARQTTMPDAVSVDDGRVRPFVWRLMAAETPSVRILAAEELS
jgi:tetratricopeptide (TPR) repeat protein